MTPGCLLAVDDDELTLTMLEHQLKKKGHRVFSARGGAAGLDLLRQHGDDIETVLLDRRMPEIDGITIVQQMREDEQLRHIPVVMLTGADSITEMREGLDAGVYYYLVKPAQEVVLDSVVEASLREHRQRRSLHRTLERHQLAYQYMDSGRFYCTTLGEAEALASFLACCFPDPERALTGLAELLFNAVEHGNLGIGYVEKSQLLANGMWEKEVLRRLTLPENVSKRVEVVFQRKPDGTYVQITDMGEGFDWQPYLTIDPGRATHNHGRGIAQANAQSFDALKYNSKGNQVLAMVAHEDSKTLDW